MHDHGVIAVVDALVCGIEDPISDVASIAGVVLAVVSAEVATGVVVAMSDCGGIEVRGALDAGSLGAGTDAPAPVVAAAALHTPASLTIAAHHF